MENQIITKDVLDKAMDYEKSIITNEEFQELMH